MHIKKAEAFTHKNADDNADDDHDDDDDDDDDDDRDGRDHVAALCSLLLFLFAWSEVLIVPCRPNETTPR